MDSLYQYLKGRPRFEITLVFKEEGPDPAIKIKVQGDNFLDVVESAGEGLKIEKAQALYDAALPNDKTQQGAMRTVAVMLGVSMRSIERWLRNY